MDLKITSKATWLTALMAGAMLCSCTNEAPVIPDSAIGGVEANNIVRLRLDGLTGKGTRAESQTMEALDRERTINELYAVAFADCTNDEGIVTGPQTLGDGTTLEHGQFYEVYKVTLPGETEGAADGGDGYLPETTDTDLPHFRLDNTGKFRFFFVANPGDKIRAALNDKTILVPGQSTKDDLMALETGTHGDTEATRTGLCDVSLSDFLMFSYDSDGYVVENRTGDEQTINIKMQRAAARFDIVNMAEGYTITDVRIIPFMTQTHLGQLNESVPFTEDNFYGVYFENADGWHSLSGSTTDPGYFSSRFYCYEYLTTDGQYPEGLNPTITVEYSPADNTNDKRTVTINFREPKKYSEQDIENGSVANGGYDNEGNEISGPITVPQGAKKGDYIIVDNGTYHGILYSDQFIPIQRNHLYRVRLTKIDNVNETLVLPLLEVADWNEAEILRPNPDDLQFDTPEKEVYPEHYVPLPAPQNLQEIHDRFIGLADTMFLEHYYSNSSTYDGFNYFTTYRTASACPLNTMPEICGSLDEDQKLTKINDWYQGDLIDGNWVLAKKARAISEKEFNFLYPQEGPETLVAFGLSLEETEHETKHDDTRSIMYHYRFGGTPFQSIWCYTSSPNLVKVMPTQLTADEFGSKDTDGLYNLMNQSMMAGELINFSLPSGDYTFPVCEVGKEIRFFNGSFNFVNHNNAIVPIMVYE